MAGRHRLQAAGTYATLAIAVAIALLPFVWMVLTSLKPNVDIATYPPRLFFEPTLDHYGEVIQGRGALSAIFDSLVVATASTLLSTLIGGMAGYAMARFDVGGKFLGSWILSQRMLPPIAIVIPIFILFRSAQLLDTYWVLILMYTIMNLPLSIWLIRSFVWEVPMELDEAAWLDGASIYRTLWQVIFPILRPGLVAAGTLAFVVSWNEFLFALILVGNTVRTVPIVAAGVVTDREILWGQMAAMGTLAAIPIVALTIIAQKHLIRGLSFGALR